MTPLDVIAAVIVVAIIFVLVRPQSKGAQLVTAITTAFTAIVASAADISSAEAGAGR